MLPEQRDQGRTNRNAASVLDRRKAILDWILQATHEVVDNAEYLRDLVALPGNRLEALRGGRAGQHGIRIGVQWRIRVRWMDDGPCNVKIVDCH